jgi:hypothetical protein
MNVSAIIVTRGDVDLGPVLDSLPTEWEIVVWNNGEGYCRVLGPIPGPLGSQRNVPNLSVYGRYAAIEYASNDLIYVQDDDVIISDPLAIVTAWCARVADNPRILPPITRPDGSTYVTIKPGTDHVVCNMPQEFRHSFYEEHALVGFGAAFHRDTPQRIFAKIGFDGKTAPFIDDDDWSDLTIRVGGVEVASFPDAAFVRRTCDIPVTALAETAFVDIPKENLPYAYGDDRMWRQPQHQAERSYMLEQVLKIKGIEAAERRSLS